MIGCKVINQAAWEKFSSLKERNRYIRLRGLSHEKKEGDFEITGVPEGVMVLPLEDAKKIFGSLLQNRFEKWLEQENDHFACLNGALSTEQLVLYVPPKTKADNLHIVHKGGEGLLIPRLHIYVGKGAELKLTLDQLSPGTVNRFLDFTLEEGAHVQLYLCRHAHQQIDTIRATLKRDARFKSVNTMKTVFQRQNYSISLLGENSHAELFGVSELEGVGQAHTNVVMEHIAPHTTSSQKFKGVVDGKGRASFEGKIHVHPQAQKTDAYQMSNYLVLSPRATANSKPNLEIFADDVKASHGATVGQIDPEHLFYLQSRGVDNAKQLLIQGFVQEIYDHIS